MTQANDIKSKVFYGTANVPSEYKGGVVAIGNFDGVHIGHTQLLETALAQAKKLDVPALVLTFEPHPRTWFNPKKPVFRLTQADVKAKVFIDMGFDAVVVETFNGDFAAQLPEDFTNTHLVENLNNAHVVTGYNFHFGKNRGGTPEFLKAEGDRLGFGVTQISAVEGDVGQEISSSVIRAFLRDGNIKEAQKLLGRKWQVSGEVVMGAQIGRTLGFPTANLKLPENIELRHGIYAVLVTRENDETLHGVASFGRRPTFDNGAPILETFIFDFDEEIYGETITISFVDWIREELKFDGIEPLIIQIKDDVDRAKAILKKL